MSDAGPPSAGGDTLSIQRTATIFGWIWAVSALVLLGPFAWATLRGELVSILEKISPEQIRDFTLFAYFASWVVAMAIDLRIHRSSYQGDMRKRGVVLVGLGTALLLVGIAVILIWSRTSAIKLAVTLDLFFVANVLAWLQANKLTERLIASTRTALHHGDKSEQKLAQLNIVASYIGGRWQLYRFCAMLVIICVVNLVALSVSARDSIASLLHWMAFAESKERVSSFLPDVSILLFVLVAEIWSWSQRVTSVLRTRRLRGGLSPNHPRLAEYMVQFFDQQFKAINYLMIAHAAALLATMTVVKDYLSALKGSSGTTDLALATSRTIGSFVGYFSWGLALAILAYVMLSIARDTVMSIVLLNSGKTPDQTPAYVAWILSAGSALLLLTGIFTVAGQVSGVRIPI